MGDSMIERIWGCKIGGKIPEDLKGGMDSPMRNAVEAAFFEITGVHAEFNFSGWACELNEPERACVEDRPIEPLIYEVEKLIGKDSGW